VVHAVFALVGVRVSGRVVALAVLVPIFRSGEEGGVA
jgi:hypothetical protein